ncbi:MAG: protein of unknown function with transrane region [Candidatus Adlerbacteria bacterium]|nr:protein of unknown function with transrane region [Candidatus Adlerbacteria bacterium]
MIPNNFDPRKLSARLSGERVLRALDPYIIPAIVVLVGVGAFGLGRLQNLESAKGAVVLHGAQVAGVEQAVHPAPAPTQTPMTGPKVYVASKNGTKYYLPACSGAKRIAAVNQVWFSTAQDAKNAGYGPAANCPGL